MSTSTGLFGRETNPNDRTTQANNWFTALVMIGGLSTALAFFIFGAAFGEPATLFGGSTFNAAAAFGGAIGTAIAYLPFVAIIDVLRRTN